MLHCCLPMTASSRSRAFQSKKAAKSGLPPTLTSITCCCSGYWNGVFQKALAGYRRQRRSTFRSRQNRSRFPSQGIASSGLLHGMLKVELLSTVKGASPITRLAADGQPLKEIDGDIEFAPALTSDFPSSPLWVTCGHMRGRDIEVGEKTAALDLSKCARCRSRVGRNAANLLNFW